METTKEERAAALKEAERVIGSLAGQANRWCRVPLKAQLSSAGREAGLIHDLDKLEAENERLKDYITRRAHDEHVQCCISRELVATWERDTAKEEQQ